MDYEKEYKGALERAKKLYERGTITESLSYVFPELREEFEDEKIRKRLIHLVKKSHEQGGYALHKWDADEMLTWLEKQGRKKPAISDDALREGIAHFGITQYQIDNWLKKYVDVEHEQKSADEVKPKFQKGDWITNGYDTLEIIEVKPLAYILQSQDGNIEDDTISYIDETYDSFTIEDAKDGDVLADSLGNVCIYQEPSTKLMYHSYCYGNHKCFIEMGGSHEIAGSYPATKEQRNTLMKTMADAGWEFDFEKKELKKISQRMISAEAKEAMYGKPTAWSEEDEKTLQGIIDEIRANKNYAPDYDIETYDRFLTWLKSLRPQPKQRWSEEDETGWTNTMIMIKEVASNHYTKDSIKLVVNFLKSLKDKYTWKPSDEQMEALKEACDEHWEPDGLDPLYTLYQELKKL